MVLQVSPGPMLEEYWTGNGAIGLVNINYWPSEVT